MNKQEFLNKLLEALLENMDRRSAQKHMDYYDIYISSEVKKGKSEQEVVEALGNPRLIVKSIVNRGDFQGTPEVFESENEKKNFSNNRNNSNNNDKKDFNVYINGKHINPIIAKIISIISIILILFLVIIVVYGVSWILFRIVLPLVLIMLLVSIIFKKK